MDIVLDFETENCGGVDLTKVGSTVYAQHPLTNVISCTYESTEGTEVWTPQDGSYFLWGYAKDPKCIFIAHSAGFEKDIWQYVMVEVHGFPPIPNERWRDTQAVCAWKALPLGLEDAADALTLDNRKDPDGHKLMRSITKPDKQGAFNLGPEKLSQIYEYNKRDILCQSELHGRLGILPPKVLAQWQRDQTINERGIRIDLDYCHAALRVVEAASQPLTREFNALTGLNPGQRDRLIEWLETRGVYVRDLTKERVATLIGPEEAPFTEYTIDPKAARALRIRQLINHSSTKKLARMIGCVARDGRAHRLLQWHGTGPGRWAGRLFNPQNFPRGTVRIDGKPPSPQVLVNAIMTGDPEYVEAVIGSPAIECVASGLRHGMVAGAGRVFNSGDFARIQCYLVLALAGQYDVCERIEAGFDPYCDMATQIYGREITKRDTEQRQTGKNTILGCGFQMGPSKFCQKYIPGCQCRGMGGQCSAKDDETYLFAERAIRAYREKTAPMVPKVWRGLEYAALATVQTRQPHDAYMVAFSMADDWLVADLPSGDRLWYFKPRLISKEMPWTDEDGDPIYKPAWKFTSFGATGASTVDAYGGIITENVVMALEVALVNEAIAKCEANGFPVVFTGHDEILAEPATSDLKALEQIMTDRPDWAKRLKVPIQIESWDGDRYRK